jgi:flavodoxin I
MPKNILLVYGSSTGNTESLSYYIADLIKKAGHTLNLKDVCDINGSVFDTTYDLHLICVSTWGIEPAELQEDFEFFWKALDKGKLRGKNFMVFGMGDAYYPYFAVSKDMVEEDIVKYGGIVALQGLKIQDPWEDYKKEINEAISHI